MNQCDQCGRTRKHRPNRHGTVEVSASSDEDVTGAEPGTTQRRL